MDSITHIALGASIGELMLSPKMGKKALLFGALAQSLPDFDFIASFFISQDAALLAHRGLTHSILFAFVAGTLLAVLVMRFRKGPPISLIYLVVFFILQMLIHDILDISNAYGTGLFEPFNHHRFSIHLLYVFDPLFTIGLFVALLVLAICKGSRYFRRRWAIIGLLPCFVYIGISFLNKSIVDQKLQTTFVINNIKPDQYILTPTPFNTLLWYIVAKKGENYYTGYQSVFDSIGLKVILTQIPKNDSNLPRFPDNPALNNLITFAEGYYILELRPHTYVFDVLRFGQIQGWNNPHAPFVFHYFLNTDSSNSRVMQRSRFEGWNANSLKQMFRRIAGKELIDTGFSKNSK